MAGSNQDIHDSKQAQLTLLSISEGTAAAVGDAFFPSLVQHLAEAFRVDFAFVSELVDAGTKRARVISFWDGEGHGETFEYDTVDTPCEQVLVGKQAVHYATQVWKRFPNDHWLKEHRIESYFAGPVLDSAGDVLGHMGSCFGSCGFSC